MNRLAVLLAGLAILAAASISQAGWAVGVRIGGPGSYAPTCYHGGYGHPWGCRPYGYGFVYAAPVVVAPAPVVAVAPAPVVALSPEQTNEPPAAPAPAPRTLPKPTPVARAASNQVSHTANDLAALNDPSPQARADAILELGRNRDRQAVAPITRALREDSSPVVRESAARALGLIALPGSLTALQNAAMSDQDRDVRRSASFAADVIRANLKG